MFRQNSFIVFLLVILGAFVVTYKAQELTPDFEYKEQGIVKTVEKKQYTLDVLVKNTLIKSYNTSIDIKPGDIISFEGKFKDVGFYSEKFENHSYTNYLKSKGIYYICYPKKIEITGQSNSFYSIRGDIILALEKYIDKIYRTDSPIFKALFYGDRSELDELTKTSFSHTGTSHILALSGFHTGIILAFINLVLAKIPLRARGFISILVLAVYGIITGLRPSIVRAVIFFGIYYLSFICNQRYNLISSAFLTAALLVSLNPYIIYDVGFQLSFASIISIGFFMPVGRYFKIPGFISITLGAQFLTLPIVAYSFGIMPMTGLFANLAVVPMISLLMVLFLISILLMLAGSILWPAKILGVYMVKGVIWLKNLTLETNLFFENLPFSYIEITELEIWKIATYYVIIIILYKIWEIHTVKENKYEFEQLRKVVTGKE